MDERISRFRHCDPRFYPFLQRVLDRMPADVKEDVLSDNGLQILSSQDFIETCVIQYAFDHPVKSLIYLNPKALREPEHQIILTLAHGIAQHQVFRKGEGPSPAESEGKVETLLRQWGFEKELEAVRYNRAVAESRGYKKGYEWAKRQHQGYLLQHFGLYFDEWNEKGLKKMSKERFDRLQKQAGTASILGEITPSEKADAASAELSLDEAVVAGIMAAVKEIKLQEADRARSCAVGRG
jgi:hypothetical protein